MDSQIEVTVSDIRRQEKEKEISFKIHTKTTLSQFKSGSFESERNFSDLENLHSEMTANHKNCIVPTPPVRPKTESDARVRSDIQNFLYKITSHPSLHKDQFFQKFLEGESLPVFKKSQTQLMNETVKDFFRKTQEQDSYYEEKSNSINIYDQNLKICLKSADKVTKSRLAFSTLAKDIGFRFSSSGDRVVEASLASSFKVFSKNMEHVSESLKELSDKDEELLCGLFASSIQDISSIRTSLDIRVQTNIDYDEACKNSKKKREAYDKMKSSPQTKPDKLSKAHSELAEAEKKESDTKEAFFDISEKLKTEVSFVEEMKVSGFKTYLVDYVQKQIALETKCLSTLKSLYDELVKI